MSGVTRDKCLRSSERRAIHSLRSPCDPPVSQKPIKSSSNAFGIWFLVRKLADDEPLWSINLKNIDIVSAKCYITIFFSTFSRRSCGTFVTLSSSPVWVLPLQLSHFASRSLYCPHDIRHFTPQLSSISFHANMVIHFRLFPFVSTQLFLTNYMSDSRFKFALGDVLSDFAVNSCVWTLLHGPVPDHAQISRW